MPPIRQDDIVAQILISCSKSSALIARAVRASKLCTGTKRNMDLGCYS